MSGWNLTHLKLQKVLYILQMFHLGRHDTPLFFGSFEAWDYGPVEPGVYASFSGFGAEPLPEWAFFEYDLIPQKDNEEDLGFIKEVLDVILSKTAGFLVALTHDELGAWGRLYEEGVKGIPISNEDMKAEYERRFKKTGSGKIQS
jgi:uncharacterized phage-associated protein